MSDDSRHGSGPLLPGLIGGLVGATLVDATHRQNAAQLRGEMEQLAAVERERLAGEQKRLALAQTESQRNESERAYRHAVLWLEHCDNNERLDWFVWQHGPELADRAAASLLDETRKSPEPAALFAAKAAAVERCRRASEAKHDGETQLAAARRRCWTGTNVWLCGAVPGLVILLSICGLFGAAVIVGYVLFLAALALASPLILRLQRTPAGFFATSPRQALTGSMRDSLARLESALAAAKAEISSASLDLALAREALSQAFAARRPALLADAIRHIGATRARLDELQAVYPPRVRCGLAAIPNATLHIRLAPHLPAALDRALAKLI